MRDGEGEWKRRLQFAVRKKSKRSKKNNIAPVAVASVRTQFSVSPFVCAKSETNARRRWLGEKSPFFASYRTVHEKTTKASNLTSEKLISSPRNRRRRNSPSGRDSDDSPPRKLIVLSVSSVPRKLISVIEASVWICLSKTSEEFALFDNIGAPSNMCCSLCFWVLKQFCEVSKNKDCTTGEKKWFGKPCRIDFLFHDLKSGKWLKIRRESPKTLNFWTSVSNWLRSISADAQSLGKSWEVKIF